MDAQEGKLERAVFPLLNWYQENARVLPWRTDHTPYRVWVSEIMLQQTRVAAVIGYFERFMAALPTPQALAEVPEDALMKLWQGLGYYNRARNLQKAARQIVTDYGGELPPDYDAIRALPGVGDYTAGAIASIAFGLPVPAVERLPPLLRSMDNALLPLVISVHIPDKTCIFPPFILLLFL